MIARDPRYELKLLCPGPKLSQAHLWLRLHPSGLRAAYPPRWVNSLYFDSHQLGCLADNLDGLVLRNKLRLRWYGAEYPIVHPHLEMKHRQGLVGTKAILPLDGALNLEEPWSLSLRRLEAHLSPLWQSRFQGASRPVLINRYWREYYVTADNTVRVTLDSRQMAYDQRLTSRPNLRSSLPIENLAVIEIKAGHNHADRVQDVANAFPIPRTRNSKYAKGMLAALYSQ